MVCSSLEHHFPRGWDQFDIYVVFGALTAHQHTNRSFLFLTLELPRRYISVCLTGVSDFMNIFLTFYIDYNASALSANAAIRSAVAAAFPLFTVQLFTNVSPGFDASLTENGSGKELFVRRT